MFERTIISQLKQSNISSDIEKSKERVRQVWKAASATQKREVAELAGVAINTVYRVIATGSLSAKIAVALGQTLNIDPFYLIGASEDCGECTEELIEDLFVKHGYDKLLAEHKRAQKKAAREAKRASKQNADNTAAEEIAQNFHNGVIETLQQARDEMLEQEAIDESPAANEASPSVSILTMSDDEIMLLVHSLKLKAGFGVPSAMEALKQIDEILLS